LFLEGVHWRPHLSGVLTCSDGAENIRRSDIAIPCKPNLVAFDDKALHSVISRPELVAGHPQDACSIIIELNIAADDDACAETGGA
jgi:hypothetical protein